MIVAAETMLEFVSKIKLLTTRNIKHITLKRYIGVVYEHLSSMTTRSIARVD